MDKLSTVIQQQNVTKIEKNCTIPTENDDNIITSDNEYNCNQHGIKGWLLFLIKNRTQCSSVSAGLQLLMVSGLHIGWGVYRIYPSESWAYSMNKIHHFFVISVFYLSANIGSATGAKLNNVMEKKKIYYICAVLNIISGLLFTIGNKEMAAIFIGRILAGFAFGITYLITIIHASENCVKELRGLLLTVVNYSLVTQLLAIMGLNTMADTDNDVITLDFLVGIMTLIYTVLAILLTPFLTYESNVYLILKGKDDMAIKNMMTLRNVSTETRAIRNDYQEIKTMIEENNNENQNCCVTEIAGFIIVSLTKILSSISTMMAINMVMLVISALKFQSVSIGGLILIIPRLITPLIPIITSDYIGRRKLIIFSGFSSGICLFSIGVLLTVFQTDSNLSLPIGLIVLVIMYQSFIGLGINNIPDILMSEAFSVARKANSISFLIIFENIIQMIGVAIFVYVTIITKYYAIISIIFSIIMIGLTINIAILLPETKQKSLLETKILFRKFIFILCKK